jgi:hypothetical protein
MSFIRGVLKMHELDGLFGGLFYAMMPGSTSLTGDCGFPVIQITGYLFGYPLTICMLELCRKGKRSIVQLLKFHGRSWYAFLGCSQDFVAAEISHFHSCCW